MRDKILALLTTCPEACNRAVLKMAGNREGIVRLAALFNAIGLTTARQLLRELDETRWTEIKNADFSQHRSLHESYADLLASCMEFETAPEPEDPFQFLEDLSDSYIATLIRTEAPVRLAFFCVQWKPERVPEILKHLPAPLRRQTIEQIGQIQKIPDAVAQQIIERFAQQMRRKLQGKLPPPAPIIHPKKTAPQAEPTQPVEVPAENSRTEASLARVVAAIDTVGEQKFLKTMESDRLLALNSRAQALLKDLSEPSLVQSNLSTIR